MDATVTSYERCIDALKDLDDADETVEPLWRILKGMAHYYNILG